MRNIREISIEKAIMHILDNQKESIELSDNCWEINDEKEEFLKKHILTSLLDDKTRAATFIGKTNPVKEYCNEIFDDNNLFIENSQEIAKKLFGTMANKSISPGDLIISTFISNEKKYLAILKMNYNKVYRHKKQIMEDETVFIDLVVDKETSLPNLSQKLQKCAFVQPFESNNDYDMILLDKQTMKSTSPNKDISQFFFKSFLESDLVKDDKYKTRVFLNTTIKWVNKNIEKSQERKKILSHMYSLVENQPEINVREFADIFKNEEKKEEYLKKLHTDQLFDYEIKPDAETVKQRINTIVVSTAEGIEIKIKKTYFCNSTFYEQKELEDGRNMIIIYTKDEITIN